MGSIISSLFISLDGVVESPDKWSFDHFDGDMMQELQYQLDLQDAVLLGRVTYDEWASYWPTSTDEPFASYINNVQKYVVSSTLKSADWNNTKLLNGDLKDQMEKLKKEPNKTIGIAGSPGLVRSLIEKDLLDRLTLTIHPVVAGPGARLFPEDGALKRFKLTRSKTTETGVIIAEYEPR